VPKVFPGGLRASSGNGRHYHLLLLLLGLLLTVTAQAEGFRVLNANTYLDGNVYRLNASIDWPLAQNLVDALHNGVSLTFKLHMQVFQRREWLWDENIARINQRFHLEYHALARQFVATNLNSGEFNTFPNLTAALGFIGHVNHFPLLDRSLVKTGETYYVRLRARLEIEALPAPMRPIAYLSGDYWRLSSEWYTCSL
jgi:hypothetical protein